MRKRTKEKIEQTKLNILNCGTTEKKNITHIEQEFQKKKEKGMERNSETIMIVECLAENVKNK